MNIKQIEEVFKEITKSDKVVRYYRAESFTDEKGKRRKDLDYIRIEDIIKIAKDKYNIDL